MAMKPTISGCASARPSRRSHTAHFAYTSHGSSSAPGRSKAALSAATVSDKTLMTPARRRRRARRAQRILCPSFPFERQERQEDDDDDEDAGGSALRRPRLVASNVMRRRAWLSRLRSDAMPCSTFSTTTTAQSTRSPIAMARPPSDMMLAESPQSCITPKVESAAQRQNHRHDDRRAQITQEEKQEHNHHDNYGFQGQPCKTGPYGFADLSSAAGRRKFRHAAPFGQALAPAPRACLSPPSRRCGRRPAPRSPRTRPHTASDLPLRLTTPSRGREP